MKASVIQANGELLWQEVPDPIIARDEVLVKVAFAGVNRADVMQLRGDYPAPPGCPDGLGLEISGFVAAVGDGAEEKWRIGDRVCCLLGGGGYSEYAAVHKDMCLPAPENFSMEEAAALPEALATAYLNLVIEGNARPGETLLVTAGTSGLASVVIPFAKAIGLRVLTTVRSDPALIADSGADAVIDTRTQVLSEFLRGFSALGRSVDIALDCLGGNALAGCLPYFSRGGRWIVIAALAGDIAEVDMRTLYEKNIRMIGSTLRSRSPKLKAHILSELTRSVWDKVEAREIVPKIAAVVPAARAGAACDMLLRGKNAGKIVLKV